MQNTNDIDTNNPSTSGRQEPRHQYAMSNPYTENRQQFEQRMAEHGCRYVDHFAEAK
jgi:hypothetical protein